MKPTIAATLPVHRGKAIGAQRVDKGLSHKPNPLTLMWRRTKHEGALIVGQEAVFGGRCFLPDRLPN